MHKLKSIFKYAYKYKNKYMLGIGVLLLVDLVQLAPPKIIGVISDSLSTGYASDKFILKFVLLLLAAASVIAAGRFIWRIFIIGTSKNIEYDIRNTFFKHLQSMSINFYNSKKTGDLMALATNDLNSVVHALGFGVVMIVDSIFMSFITIIIMLSINTKLTIISLIPLPFISIIASKFGKKIHKKYMSVQKAYSSLTDIVQENLSGIRVVKSYVQEDSEFEKFSAENNHNLKENMEFAKLWGLLHPLVELLASLGFVIFIGLGGLYVIQGDISLGDFVAFNMYLGQLVWPMMAIGWVINVIQRGFASLERIEEILKENPEIVSTPGVHTINSINGDIDIKDLTFYYKDTKEPALKNINLHVNKGETLGIIGRTGSGKSTLVNLLVRLFNIDDGKITINGYDINSIPLKTLRENIALASDPFLFSSNITENINLSQDSLNIEAVIKASKDADIYDNIMDFPEGFDTIVGERGVTLSGGQKQRVSIARALIKDPEILILDDCLSAVDAKTEAKILENLKSIMMDRTSIIISHRISAVKNSDNILVLDEGEIVEQGKHSELISLKGLYNEIYEKQLIEEKIQEEGDN
ncbi:ABC transporter ATP-binding protein [Clostridium polynesiense]|uniref:ABC transporter ATP-binding protein n=1 Tax=Clostridium polynesiense TaxID=1325933 RepID=UPI00058BE1A9|nr:ABC transporter ATP-binding protein [Clostridium polynesiense]